MDQPPLPKKKWRRGLGSRKTKRHADRMAEVERDQRRAKVYALYAAGKTFREVAAELGIGHTTARRDFDCFTRDAADATRAEQRARSTAALELVRSRILPLTEPDEGKRTVADRCAAARTVIREVAVHARINGLERPIQVELAPVGMRDAYDDLLKAIGDDENEDRTTH